MATIESKDETVSDVFTSFYVVPDYQREYVWEEAQVDQLLRDIRTEQLDGGEAEYFIGSVVVCPRNDGAFDLIDGQQRTTTLFVTFCAIRDRLGGLGETATASISKLIADTTADAEGNDVFRTRLDPQYADAGDVFANCRKAGYLLSPARDRCAMWPWPTRPPFASLRRSSARTRKLFADSTAISLTR
jgi:Protein of unknown function DUF262